MSNFTVEITDPGKQFITIETSILDQPQNNIEIEKFQTFNIEIINTEKVLASDLPDDIPMSKIIGNLNVARIEGLDDYLDNYEFDCGTP
jgi:hypothetical protein